MLAALRQEGLAQLEQAVRLVSAEDRWLWQEASKGTPTHEIPRALGVDGGTLRRRLKRVIRTMRALIPRRP